MSVIPLLDILLILLVVLVLFADLNIKKTIKVSLPSGESGDISYAEYTTIHVIDSGDIFLDGVKLSYDKMLFQLGQSSKDRMIRIACDKNLKYDKVVSIIDSVKKLGFDNISIVLDPQ